MDTTSKELYDDVELMAKRLDCEIYHLTDACSRRLDVAITEHQSLPETTFHRERMYVTGEYGMEQQCPSENADIIVFVEVGCDAVPTKSKRVQMAISHIVGSLHDATASEIEMAVGQLCDIAYFPSPELLEQSSVDIRPITKAARATCGLTKYSYRDNPTVCETATVYDMTRHNFIPIRELE